MKNKFKILCAKLIKMTKKQAEGFYIKGYDNQNPTFKYYAPIYKQNDPVINVGGVSEPFVTWASNKTYAVGTIVKNGSDYYRAKETHLSSTEFEEDKFIAIPDLPVTGGRTAYLRNNYENAISTINYGFLIWEIPSPGLETFVWIFQTLLVNGLLLLCIYFLRDYLAEFGRFENIPAKPKSIEVIL